MRRFAWFVTACLVCGCLLAEEPPEESTNGDSKAQPTAVEDEGGPEDLVRLTKDFDVWISPKRKIVVVDGEVCLREGLLEMFACPKATKEHESVVALNTKAYVVHAALLAVGAVPGTTVQFDPEYKPATGTTVKILILWTDKEGMRRKTPAQQWIRNLKTEKAMEHDWVFGGSGFWFDETEMKRYYHAEGGDLICVSNFPTATLDLPIKSSQANADLLFEAFTENIPEKGTKVRLVLMPQVPAKAPPESAPEDASSDDAPSLDEPAADESAEGDTPATQ